MRDRGKKRDTQGMNRQVTDRQRGDGQVADRRLTRGRQGTDRWRTNKGQKGRKREKQGTDKGQGTHRGRTRDRQEREKGQTGEGQGTGDRHGERGTHR